MPGYRPNPGLPHVAQTFSGCCHAAAISHGAWAEPAQTSNRADLLTIYQDALANNADLAAAQAEYQAQREVVPQARAGLLPQVNAGANVSDTRSEVDSSLGTQSGSRSGIAYQASLSQPIFRADRWFQLQAAQASSEQAALQFSATSQGLILQSAEAYFGVLRAQDNLATTKAEEAAFKRQLDQANERFDVGLSDKTDVLEAQASYDNARANRLIAERNVDDAFQALTTLTDRDYEARWKASSTACRWSAADAERRTSLGRYCRATEPQPAGQQLCRAGRRGNPAPAQGRPCAHRGRRGQLPARATTTTRFFATVRPATALQWRCRAAAASACS